MFHAFIKHDFLYIIHLYLYRASSQGTSQKRQHPWSIHSAEEKNRGSEPAPMEVIAGWTFTNSDFKQVFSVALNPTCTAFRRYLKELYLSGDTFGGCLFVNDSFQVIQQLLSEAQDSDRATPKGGSSFSYLYIYTHRSLTISCRIFLQTFMTCYEPGATSRVINWTRCVQTTDSN